MKLEDYIGKKINICNRIWEIEEYKGEFFMHNDKLGCLRFTEKYLPLIEPYKPNLTYFGLENPLKCIQK
jgi:hypothetical protein